MIRKRRFDFGIEMGSPFQAGAVASANKGMPGARAERACRLGRLAVSIGRPAPGVCGQINASARIGPERIRRIDLGARREQPDRAVLERIDIEIVELLIEHGVGDSYHIEVVDRVAYMPAQHRAGTNFEKHPLAHFNRALNALLKQDRLANVAPPVALVDGTTGDNRVGDRRKKRRGAARRLEIGQAFEKRPSGGLHEGSMKRVVKVQPLHPHLLRLACAAGESIKGVDRSSNHNATVRIMRGDRELRERAGEGNRYLAGTQDRGHAALIGDRLLMAATVKDDFDGVRQREGSRRFGRGDLAHAVAHR